jgi:hypothetical protein
MAGELGLVNFEVCHRGIRAAVGMPWIARDWGGALLGVRPSPLGPPGALVSYQPHVTGHPGPVGAWPLLASLAGRLVGRTPYSLLPVGLPFPAADEGLSAVASDCATAPDVTEAAIAPGGPIVVSATPS